MNRVNALVPTEDKQATRWLLILGLICLLVFIATIPLPRVDGHLVGSDGTQYYAILRSLVLDQDFNLINDNDLLDVRNTIVPETGMAANPFAIGSALLWLPFFAVAHVLSLFLNMIGVAVPTNGLSYIYEAAVLIGTIIYAGLGFFFCYKVARRLFDVESSLIATLAIWLAAQGIYYIVAEPSMSHALTIFANALFLFIWYPASPNRTNLQWFLLGLTTALVALVRWQEGVIIIIPLIELFWWAWKKEKTIKVTLQHLLIFSLAVLIGFIPQFLMWNSIYGSPLLIPQGNDFMHWFAPKPLQTLFSTRHGLFTWHPILLLSFLGVIPLWRKDKVLALIVVGAFLFQLYINSVADHWWADDAFGGRRFTGLIPLMTISLAALLNKFKDTRWYKFILLLLLLLVIWNGLSFAQYRLGFIAKDAALTLQEMTIDRMLLPWTLLQKVIGFLLG